MAKREQSGGLMSRLFGRGAAADAAAEPSDIERVMAASEIRIVYQPIVDLKTHAIFAYEALLRSASPAFSGPLPMLEAAIKANCLSQLGRAARTLAVENCQGTPLFINIHPSEFNDGLLVQPDDPIFWHNHTVHVEITESVPLSHFELCNSVLAELRGKGIRLAIDDLGAGYSNLKYIADLTPDVVKIDRELVSAIAKGTRHRMLVSHIVDLCAGMGAKVVAEGIETVTELRAVQEAGVDFGQGYLLARPGFPPPVVSWPSEGVPGPESGAAG